MSKGKIFYPPNDQCATFYIHPNFEGDKQTYCANSNITCHGGTLQSKNGEYNCVVHNDKYDSMTKNSGLHVTMYQHMDFSGAQTEFGSTTNSVNRFSNWWGDTASSIKVQKDCSDAKWIWDDDCRNERQNTINSDQMFNNTKIFCNDEDYEKVFSKNCETWCATNNDHCIVRNRYLTCETLEISKDSCNQTEIDNINQQCTKKLSVGSPYACTVSGLAKLQKDCTELNLSEECTSGGVAKKKEEIRKDKEFQESEAAKAERAKEARDQADKHNQALIDKGTEDAEYLANEVAKNTELLLQQKELEAERNRQQQLNILGITTPPPKKDDTIMYIIISIVMCILVMSSSSSILGLIIYSNNE